MFCPNCGNQVPNTARVCGHCGFKQGAQFQQPYQQPPIQQPVPIIVQTKQSGGLFSGCGGLLNVVFSALVIGAIALIVLVFLCIIRLPSEFPIINPPAPVADLWLRAVAWQGGSCMNRSQPPAGNPAVSQNQGDTGATACNRSKFVRETIPDHTVFEPGEKFTKTWTVRNDGNCAWTTGYTFRFTQGSQMSGVKSIALSREVKPGDTYTFELGLTAPEQDGTYTGRWEIFDAQGNSFGWYSAVIDVGAGGQEPQSPPDKEATIIVTPSNGPVGTIFSVTLSGYKPNSVIQVTCKSLDSDWIDNEIIIIADQDGKNFYNLISLSHKPGQYVITGIADGVEGSAVFIVEEVSCNADIATEAECTAAGGTWQVVRLQTGPNQYYCSCP